MGGWVGGRASECVSERASEKIDGTDLPEQLQSMLPIALPDTGFAFSQQA